MALTTIKNKEFIHIATSPSDEIYLDTRENAKGQNIIKGKKIMPFYDMAKNEGVRCLYSGSTGSGKSYMCKQAIKQIKPSKIYLFSSVDDGDYDEFKNLMKVDLHQIIKNTGLDIHQIYEYMEDKCVAIFDDIMSYGTKLAAPYLELRRIMLQKSRHKKQSVFVCEQTAQGGNIKGSREVLLNCAYFVCFPRNNFKSFNSLASTYLGLDKNQIEKMKNLGRYIMISKNYPSYYVSSSEAGML
jgi:hypothetical protein